MSFGFSIGDIILVAQLSYKLYGTVTSGRRNATRELKELADVLFGLRCALSHLRNVAGDISKTASESPSSDSDRREAQQALDQMIENCAITLEDLDNATKKYRDGAMIADIEDDSLTSQGQKRRTRLKSAITRNWAKIKWDMDKDSLKMYRDRLQSHVDAINLVLSTFHWSTTEKIHAQTKTQADKMQEFHDNMLQSNSSLAHLVEAMHSMLLSKQPSSTTRMLHTDDGFVELSGIPAGGPSIGVGGLAERGIQSLAAHHAPMLDTMSTRINTARVSLLSVLPGQKAPHSSMKRRICENELPPEIASINIKRQSHGAKALADLKQSLTPKPPPSFLTLYVPIATQLSESLKHIFNPLQRSTEQQFETARQARIKEIVSWTQSLDHLVNSLAIPRSATAGGNNRLAVSAQHSDLIDLLSKINEAIETSSPNMRDMAYEGFSAARIDHILDRVLSLTNSVRAQKEIEEFMEERSDWAGAN